MAQIFEMYFKEPKPMKNRFFSITLLINAPFYLLNFKEASLLTKQAFLCNQQSSKVDCEIYVKLVIECTNI